MWREGQCRQEIALAKAVTFKTSSLLRGASLKPFGEPHFVFIATVSQGGWYPTHT